MTVIVCGDHLAPGAAERLDVIVVDGWCRRPAIPAHVESLSVIAQCVGEYSVGMVQRALRRVGVDPFGVAEVAMTACDFTDEARLRVRVAAARARAAAFGGSTSEQVRVTFSRRMSRRALLAVAVGEYRAGPAIDRATCRAGDGCAACVASCPHAALDWSGGEVVLDRVACNSCGRCVTACPVGALVDPTCTPVQLEAEVVALAEETGGAAGVELVCGRSTSTKGYAGWYPVSVPCTAMLPPHWIIAPLVLGCAAVTVRSCVCREESDAAERVSRTQAFAAGWVKGTAFAGRILAPGEKFHGGSVPRATAENPFGHGGAAAVAEALGHRDPLDGALSPLGVVSIEESSCTGCAICADSCPTDALEATADGDTMSLLFTAARCTGCATCLTRCPELARGAIRLERRVDPSALRSSHGVLAVHKIRRCSRCGQDIATDAALRRVEELLGAGGGMATIMSLCLGCRARAVVPG